MKGQLASKTNWIAACQLVTAVCVMLLAQDWVARYPWAVSVVLIVKSAIDVIVRQWTVAPLKPIRRRGSRDKD